jgi:sigma-B regulation protein RsbU (phosphoserine phosphatase)
MFDLIRFGLTDTFELSAVLPEVTAGAPSLEDAAARVVRFFYDNVLDKETGERSLAVVRCFLARPFERLPAALQDLAVTASPASTPHPRQLCLTLLAAAGDEQAAHDDRMTRERTTIVLPSAAADAFTPMVAEVAQRLHRGEAEGGVLRRVAPSYAVGLVSDARDDRVLSGWSGVVVAYGIRSILTLTARLSPDTHLTVALDSKVAIPERTADAFAAVGIGLKLAMLPHVGTGALAGDRGRPQPGSAGEEAMLRVQNETLHELLRVRHEVALDQSGELQRALELAEQRAAELAISQAALAGSEARASAIVGAALDAVVVMDAGGRVVEWNPAAEATFGYPRHEAVGELVADLVVPDALRSRHTKGLEDYLATGEGPLIGQRVEITAMHRDGGLLPVELTITPVQGGGGGPVFTAFIRDITERRERQAELVESRENFAHIARTLQRSLLPAALPQVAGLELGAVFHPSRAGSDVGGDFYDVFRLGRTDLMLTLGDVCGKGAEAAAITAIARHTVRAVAPDLRHPSVILRRLNDALADHDIGERFLSIVTARAVPIVRGLRLSVCCAGHAQPMVVRAGGDIERVGVPGDLLGLFPEVRLFEETVQLARGDTFVVFTDGVTEAMRQYEEFGEHGLAQALLETRHRSATEIVNHVLDEVLAFGGEQSRDDIAVLAIRAVDGG